MNEIAVPCSPQPKQWYNCLGSDTVNDGERASWNGQRAEYSLPWRLSGTRALITSTMSVRARRSSMKASDSRAISAGPRQPGRCAGRLGPATRCGAPTRTTIRVRGGAILDERSEEHTSELQSLMRISYAVFC